MTTITTESGRTKHLPAHIERDRVIGLDPEGRIVVDDFGALTKPYELHPVLGAPTVFALTLCCNAYDKGAEGGVVCRKCYSYDETGDYLTVKPDGTVPGLDRVRGWSEPK